MVTSMEIISHEIRKIWNIKILAVIAVLSVLFYFMYMDWHVRHAQVSTSAGAVLIRELAERYGNRVTPEQMEEFFDERFPEVIAELEQRMSLDPAFAEMGIVTYADFIRAHQMEELDYDTWQVLNRMTSAENSRVFVRLQALQQLDEMWNNAPSQINMTGEMARYGYDEWFSKTLSAVVASEDVLSLVEELRGPLLRQADEFIAGSGLFAESGILDYEQFKAHWDARESGFVSFEHERNRWRLWRILLGPEAGFVERKLITLDGVEGRYLHSYTRGIFERQIADWIDVHTARQAEITDFAQRRIDTILENRDYLNIMCWAAYWTTSTYFGNFTRLVILATLALILPLVTVDRMRNIQGVQYAARVGRGLLHKQIAAVLISSLLLVTVLLVIFGGLYFYATGVLRFWDHSIFSWANQAVLIFDFTFGQYVLVLVAISYVFGLASALAAFIISRFSRNLISAAIKMVPVFAGLAGISFGLNSSGAAAPFSIAHRLYLWTNIVGVEAALCVVLAALSFVVALLVAKRDKRSDVA